MNNEIVSKVDKDILATELYSFIAASYPGNTHTHEEHYIKDTKYVICLLLRHLRFTALSIESLQRNSSFYKSFLQSVKYTSRTGWLTGNKKALEFFFPIN